MAWPNILSFLSKSGNRNTNPIGDGTPPFSKAGLPTKRVSIPEDLPFLQSLASDMGLFSFVLPKKWPMEIYDLLVNLSLQNPDLRQAVGHIIQLGNTGHLISVNAEEDAKIEAAVARIEKMSNQIFPYSVGPDGLVNALFGQIARSGATSMEWVPNRQLDGVEKVFLVPVSEIRWVPKMDRMGYYPVQIPKFQMAIMSHLAPIVLNERTFHYSNLEMMEGSPYALPPFLAALEPIQLQRLMLKSINKVMKKAGLMGLMTYSTEPPAQKPGELGEAYYDRCSRYLDKITDQIKNNFADGIAVGFKGAFEFEVNSVTADARGIAEIFKLNEEQLFSAIGADPAMHGRTYSTTETYASVVYSKMISQLKSIQGMVGHALEFGWGLDLALAGLTADIIVSFKSSQALSNLQEAQSDMINISNASTLYKEGIIDQNEKARLCGYTTPAESEPLPDPAMTGAGDQNIEQHPGGSSTGNNNNKKNSTVKKKQGATKSHAIFEFNKDSGRYKHVIDMNYLELDGKPATLKQVTDDHSHCDHSFAEKKKEPKVEDRYRRYLCPSPVRDGQS